MNYAEIKKTDIANGIGVRVSLFVSGCRNKCPGCFNKEAWDFNFGKPFTTQTIDEIIKALQPAYIAGLSLLGGDPLEPENIRTVTRLCRIVKLLYPDNSKTIWLYTGYTWDKVKDLEVMEYIDVLVDGKFIEELKDITLLFRGSSNQRLIDVRKSKEKGEIIKWEK